LAAIGCWVLPWLGIGESHLAVGSLHSGGAAAAAVGSLAFLAVGAWGFADAVPATLELAQLLVWALPSLVGWLVYATYDPRLLAPAWPPLLLLVALTALPALSGFARRGAVAAAVPLALFAVVVADNVYNVDGLGRSGWDELRRTPASKWFDRTTMRALVLPGLTHALTAARPQMRSQDRLLSPEGAFAFYFPGRVEQSFPNGCGYLSPFRVFVLTTDEGSKRYMENFLGVSGEPSYWASCTNPRLTQLTDGSDGYAVFRVNG
jgi:hypothetical protein